MFPIDPYSKWVSLTTLKEIDGDIEEERILVNFEHISMVEVGEDMSTSVLISAIGERTVVMQSFDEIQTALSAKEPLTRFSK